MQRKLKVRVGRNYAVTFNILHGQRNASLVSRPTNPLQRLNQRLDCVAVVEPGYDLIHNFNAIPIFSSCPFVITFEDYAPRLPENRPIPLLSSFLRKKLLDEKCIGIVAMSEYAMRQMKQQHRAHTSDLARLLAKTTIVYPAVAQVRPAPKCHASPQLKLLFVGADFFRKGGPALVRAHALLRKSGIEVQTTIISSLAWSADDYVGPPDAGSVQQAIRELAAEGIVHHRHVPNDQVRLLMEELDFLVLPTLHDTFGYVSIEALAAGTPVIASATCAQTEIVEAGRSGYLLPFDNDRDVGKWSWLYGQERPGYVDAYWSTINSLAASIWKQLENFCQQRSDYERLSAGALEQARGRFSVECARDALERIYSRAL